MNPVSDTISNVLENLKDQNKKVQNQAEITKEKIEADLPSDPDFKELKNQHKVLTKQYDKASSLVKTLNNLSYGKLEHRFLEALKKAPHNLYKAVYPRRFKEVPTHYSPKYVLISGMIDTMVGMNETRKDFAITKTFVKEGCPVYWLNEVQAKALVETDLNNINFSAGDFEWPHQAFLIMPPKGIFENSPVLTIIAREHDQMYVASILPESNRKDVNNPDGKAGYAVSIINLDCPLSEAIAEAEKDALEVELNSAKFAVNTLLAMIANPAHVPKPRMLVSSTGSGSSLKPRLEANWEPNFLTFEVPDRETDHQGGGSETSRRPHARRGHWRCRWASNHQGTLSVGSIALLKTDLRGTFLVKELGENHVVLMKGGEQTTEAIEDVVPAKIRTTWVRKAMIGLRNKFE